MVSSAANTRSARVLPSADRPRATDSLHPIAHAAHRLDEPGVIAKLGANGLDVHVHRTRATVEVPAPHAPEQRLAREDLAREAHQEGEQVKLAHGERERLAVELAVRREGHSSTRPHNEGLLGSRQRTEREERRSRARTRLTISIMPKGFAR